MSVPINEFLLMSIPFTVLYEALEELMERVLYYDMDSVIYLEEPGQRVQGLGYSQATKQASNSYRSPAVGCHDTALDQSGMLVRRGKQYHQYNLVYS